MQKAVLGFAAAMMLTLGLAAGDAYAQCSDKTIRVYNNGRVDIDYLYGSHSGTDRWGRDRLGSGWIRPGRSFVLNFRDGTRNRYYDFRAVFENGREVTRMRVDVCSESSWNVR